jgi:hypothetical protein
MQTGIFDKSRLAANVLMVVLVAMNIFFSIQYTGNIQNEQNKTEEEIAKSQERLKTARFMKLFIDKVLNPDVEISFEDRVKMEADVRGLGDQLITTQWESFVSSQGAEASQQSAIKLMSMLSSKMI